MRKIILVVGVMALAGCTLTGAPSVSSLNQEHLTYFKDTRTGMCYAAMNSITNSAYRTTTITYVPCTEGVEKQIQADKGEKP